MARSGRRGGRRWWSGCTRRPTRPGRSKSASSSTTSTATGRCTCTRSPSAARTRRSTQNFWMYFQTEPIHNGLGFGSNDGQRSAERSDRLFDHARREDRSSAKLPLTSTSDRHRSGEGRRSHATGLKGRGTRLVSGRDGPGGQADSDWGFRPTRPASPKTSTRSRFVPNELPDNPLGYEGCRRRRLAGRRPPIADSLAERIADRWRRCRITSEVRRASGRLPVGHQLAGRLGVRRHAAGRRDRAVDHKTNLEPLLSMAVPPQRSMKGPVQKGSTARQHGWGHRPPARFRWPATTAAAGRDRRQLDRLESKTDRTWTCRRSGPQAGGGWGR